MRTIEIIVDARGDIRLETHGFTGAAYLTVARRLTTSLGHPLAERLTGDFDVSEHGPCQALEPAAFVSPAVDVQLLRQRTGRREAFARGRADRLTPRRIPPRRPTRYVMPSRLRPTSSFYFLKENSMLNRLKAWLSQSYPCRYCDGSGYDSIVRMLRN